MGIFHGRSIFHQNFHLGNGHSEYRFRSRHGNLLPREKAIWRWNRVPSLRCLRDHLLYQLDSAYPLHGVHAADDYGCCTQLWPCFPRQRSRRNRDSGIRRLVLGDFGFNLCRLRARLHWYQSLLREWWLQYRQGHRVDSVCDVRYVLVQRVAQEHCAHNHCRCLRLVVLLE